MIFPKNYYRSHSFFTLLLLNFTSMATKYLKVLTTRAFGLIKSKDASLDLTYPIFRSSLASVCDECHFCEKICPTNAIQLDFKGKKLQYFKLNLMQCTRCQICIQVCPENLIGEEQLSLQVLDFDEQKMWRESSPST